MLWITMAILVTGCQSNSTQSSDEGQDKKEIRLITLDPGHFHAALVQKEKYAQIDSNVYVYAPGGAELDAHLKLIEQYNSRPDNPTNWNEIVYTGSDFAEKMFSEKKGNVVVLAGNNRLKTDYIFRSVKAGLNVLGDKPMAINTRNFSDLVKSFQTAAENKVLLYDIMTERSEITNIVQGELVRNKELFGDFKKGDTEDPAIFMESIHYYFKNVSGKPLVRPDWFFDPSQEGDAIVDVGTHLVDLVQWECFPDVTLDYQKDIELKSSRIWPTPLSPSQFRSVTGVAAYPDFLKPYVVKDSVLNTHGNGEMNYTLKGIAVKLRVRWDYRAVEGGDSHHSIMKGTKSTIEIRQGKEENYKPVLYIIPADKSDPDFAGIVSRAMEAINNSYPGITAERSADGQWRVVIPQKYDIGHEAHFAQVMQRYLKYLNSGRLPDWEVPNMIAKYYITTKSLENAVGNN